LTCSQSVALLYSQSLAPTLVNQEVPLSLGRRGCGPEGYVNRVVAEAGDIVYARLADVVSAQFHFQKDIPIAQDALCNGMNGVAIRVWLESRPSPEAGDDIDKVMRLYVDCICHRFPCDSNRPSPARIFDHRDRKEHRDICLRPRGCVYANVVANTATTAPVL
jgi:hypothetical protein